MGWALRVRARVRVLSRVAVPAAGTALGIVLAAQAAHATVSSITYTGPTSPTTGATLAWTIAATSGDALDCQLLVNGTPTAPSSACPPNPFTTVTTSAGSYVLEVTDTTDVPATPPVDSTPVVVAPPAPHPTAPTSPSNDATPTFGLGLPTGSAGACTLTAPDGTTVVDQVDPCSDPYTPGPGVLVSQGKYTLTVTATDGGIMSDPAQVDYTLDTIAPGAVTVTAPSSPATDTTPDFTIAEAAPTADTFTCTLTLPDNSTVAITTGCGIGTLTLTLSGGDGTYRLTVVARDVAGNATTSHADYVLDTSSPPVPSLSPPPSPTRQTAPVIVITDGDVTAGLTCVLTDPDGNALFTGTCPADGVFDTAAGSRDGTYTLAVTATDPAGNTSSKTVTWVRDTIAPPVPTVPAPAGLTRQISVTVSISDSEGGVALTCVLTDPDGNVLFTGTCPADGVFDTAAGSRDGTYTLVVTATDAAGNTSSKTVSWVRDSTAPPTPSVTPPGSPTNDTTPSATVSDGEAGVTLTCVLTGPNGVDFSGPCSGTVSFDTTSDIDGLYTLVVTATDAAGNASSKTVTWTQDTAAPPTPSVTPPGSPTNDTTPTATVSDGEAGVTLTCVLTGPNGVDYSGPCSGNATFDTSGDVDGLYTLVVTAKDAAGNTSSRTVTWTQDTAKPPAPTVSAPPTLTKSTSMTLTISDTEPGVTLTCLLTGPSGETVFSGICPGNGTFSTNGHIDGLYTLVVTATDAAGNFSSTTVTWTRDSTPPPTPSVTPPASPTNDTTPTATVSDSEAGVGLTCVLTGPNGIDFSGPCSGTVAFDTAGDVDGLYTLVVTATDAAGNTSTRTVTWTQDTAAPPAPTVSAPPALTNSKTVALTISDGEAGVSLTCLVTGPAGELVFTGTCPANGTFNTNGHIDGTFTLVVTATDAAGNTSTTTVSWVRDTTPPPAPTVSSPPALTRNTAVTLTIGDTEGDVVLTCLLTGPGGGTVFSGVCPVSGVFDTSGHADGTYTLIVTATDPAGNTSTATVSWVRDTTPPPPPSVTPPADPDNVVQPVVAISDGEAGVTLSCVLTGPGGIVFSGACPSNGKFSTAGDGSYSLTVTATDAAGNSSTTTVTWVLDTVAPPAPDVSAPAALTNSRTVTLAIGDSEAGVHLTCVLTGPNSGTVFSGTCPSDGLFDTTGHADGTYTLVVTATDAAGNSSTTTVSWVRDTTPPPTPVVAGNPSLTNSKTVTLTISDTEGTATLTCELTGPSGESVFSGVCPADGVFDTTGHGDGTYTLVVTATDAATNSSTKTISWVRDTVAPVTPVVTAPASPAQGRHPSFTVVEPESPVTWSCAVTGPSVVQVTSCGLVTVVNLTGAADGDYTVSVIAIDPAGNQSLAGTATYTLDTTPPPAPDVSAPPPLTKSPAISVTISDTQLDAVLTCVVTSPTGQTVFSGLCPSSGTFDTSGYADGIYQLVVTATDSAGNASTTTVTWRKDTTPPPVPVVTAPSSPGNTRAPSFTVTEPESPVTYSCTVTGPSTVTISACGLTVTLNLAGAADGTYTVYVTATDPAGNVSAAGSVSWVLDTTPPPAPTVTAPRSPGNSRAPSFTVNDTETGVHWTCSVSGPGAASVSVCGPSTVLDLTGSPDGIYTVTVSAIDAAGNVSAVGTATYRLDTTPPPAPAVTAPASPSHDLTPTYVISDSENGVVLTCVLVGPNGNTLFNGVCPVDGTFDTTGRADGVYTLTVTATDAANNSSSITVVWTRDTVAPPAPSVSAPGSPAQGRTVTFTVSDTESGVTYTCMVTGPSTVSVSSCGPSPVVNLTGAADGTYTLTVTATDAAANTSTATSASYLLDTTAPITPTVSATLSPSQGKHATFTIGGVESGGVLTCTLSGPAGSSAGLGDQCGSSVGVDLTGQPDGTYTLTVTVTDAAGNVSIAGSASYILDTTAPAAPTVSTPASLGNDTTPSFGIGSEVGASLTCTVARYFQVVYSGPCGAGGTVNLSGYEDGEFEITIFATDAAGNVGAATTVVYVLDTTAPDAPVLTSPASPSPIEKPVWLFTAEDGTKATCTITGPDGQTVQGPVACTSPFTGLFKALPDGTYVLTVVVTDAAGNVSAASTSVFILDRHAPVPPTVLPPDSPDSSHHPIWTISAPKGATLTCTLLFGHQVVYGPGACPADGSFSLVDMPDGTYTLRVTATDSAGNVSATSVTTYVLDTTKPAEPQLSYSSGGSSTDTHPYWGFTLPAGTVGRCELVRDGVVLAVKNGCKGAVSFDLTGRPLGTYTVRIYAIDAAGNMSHALTASYVLGARQPTPPPPGGGGGTPSSNPFGGGGGNNGGNGPTLGQRQVDRALQQFTNATVPVRNVVKKAAHAVHQVTSSIVPVIHDRVTEHVSKAVQGVVNAVTHVGGGTGFPLLLLVVVGAFLLMQNRIDRRDPKLALASVAADDTVEFQPPPSRGGFGGGIADGRWA